MNTTQGPLPRGWGLAACLLAGLAISPWAQAQQACSAQSFNGLQVQPASGQTLLEFNAADSYQPYTVALRTNKNLPAGGSYAWKQVNPVPPAEPVPASRAVALDTSDQTHPTFQTRDFGPGGATLAFQVTARCNGVAVATATGSITIQNVDRPPTVTALATPPIASAGDTVSLAAAASDPDGDTIAYQWAQVANGAPAVALGAPTSATTTLVAPAAASDYTLEFRVTATSNALSSSDTVLVNVSAVNLPPQASLVCTDPVDEGGPLLLDGSATYDPEGDALTYAWSVESAPAGLDLALDAETGPTVQRNAPPLGEGMDGAVVVRLRVGDGTQYTDATCAFMIHDATAPQLQLPADLTLDADSAAGTQVSTYAMAASDNVDGDVGYRIACTPAAPHLFPLATSTVDCSVGDSAGNLAQGAFHVTVADLSPPLIAAHADVAMEATGPQTDVPYDLPATSDKVDGAGLASCAPPPGPFAVGSTTVTCDATDHAGNPAVSTHFTVAVHDTTPPVIDVPADITAEASAPSGATVAYAVSASDLVSGNVGVDCDHASGSTFPLGTTSVHCSAHDAAVRPGFPQGNVATASFTVTVQDTTAPELAMPAPITLEATGPATPVAYGAATATDAVDTNVDVACTPASGSSFAVGATTITCTATDDAGNASTGQVVVTVTDTTAPALSVPANMTLEATSHAGAAATWTASASDLVDGSVAVSCTPASGATFALGAHTIDCAATDAHGNTGHRSFQVTVVDTTAPAMSPDPLPDVTATATGNSSANVDFALPTAVDIVDGARPVTCSAQPGASFNVGATVVTCSASDETGNTVARSFTVRVNYAFAGFFQPIDMNAINTAKAGSAIPVKFSLGGNQGMGIFAAGSPASGPVACDAQVATDEIETTLTAGGSTLQYDASSGQYIYVWKTDRSWLGCRLLKVTLRDGSVRTAMFKFR